jgi:general secretion pathway protein G
MADKKEARTTRRREGRRASERGFTLVELLVVMVILGLLASLVLPNFFGQAEKAREKTAKVQISTLAAALDAFALDVGRYPSTSEGLDALVQAPSGVEQWDGPYLKKSVPKDPWGNPYEYKEPQSSSDYDVISPGADQRAGSADDIKSSE